MTEANNQAARKTGGHRKLLWGLSARLMVLTIAVLMLAEFLVWAPSVSRFRQGYLLEHLLHAHLAIITVDALKAESVDTSLQERLLHHTETYSIVLNLPDQQIFMIGDDMPPDIDAEIDLSRQNVVGLVLDAFETMAQPGNRVLRVTGQLPEDPATSVEIIIDEAPMRTAMIDYSWRILGLSIIISLFTATLVYSSLQWLMVHPISQISQNMSAFRNQPEDATKVILPSDRTDEIGVAQRELYDMQKEVRRALGQKTRLSTLGAAVARVNHDLRNTLATAVLASDRLAAIKDPEVQRFMPRLYNAIQRAVRLCGQTLDYVSANDLKLQVEPFHLAELVTEVSVSLHEIIPPMKAGDVGDVGDARDAEDTGDTDKEEQVQAAHMEWLNCAPFEITITGDRHQLFRALSNIALNAQLAGATTFTVIASIAPGEQKVRINLMDNGPGLPQKTREQLFQPFAGSSRQGGTGLGLVIAHDIVMAHGGQIQLVSTGSTGTIFRMDLPGEKITEPDNEA